MLRTTRLLALGGLVLVGFLYWKPTKDPTSTRSEELEQRRAEVAVATGAEAAARGADRNVAVRRRARPGGAPARPRQAGRAALHRQGHQRLARAALSARFTASLVYTPRTRGTGRSSSVRSADPRGLSAVSPSAVHSGFPRSPSRRPATSADDRFRRSSTSPARISSRRSPASKRPAASSRWSRAAEEEPSSRRAWRRRSASSAASAPSCRAGSAARPRGSLKCLHAHAAFALARPGYELGDRVLAEVAPLWPERCCTPVPSTIVARRWRSSSHGDSGRRAIDASRSRRDDPARHRRLLAQVEIVIGELRRRVGQTFTLAELADVYDGADDGRGARSTRPMTSPGRCTRPPPSTTRRSTPTRAARATTPRDRAEAAAASSPRRRRTSARRGRGHRGSRRLRRRDRARAGARGATTRPPERRRLCGRSTRCRSHLPRVKP